ncbi:radial spoke head protein 4 homolog A isoform X1 [Hydra vulgaris]|uniref:radial spoke head protein 4 homolog A isoform X1 n=2 Tax=Hydra vulgaris TaxID=6087 RepID=UPI001F5ED4D5|nr:radial spoke head protein 4 homolog A isoform X1 [Hydra vulgaris]
MVETALFNLENELLNARSYLIKPSSDGTVIHQQLCALLERILSERPDNAADLVESYMRDERLSVGKTNMLTDLSKQIEYAALKLKLFEKKEDESVENEEEFFEVSLPNCSQLAFYFEQGSIGIGKEEIYHIFLSLKELISNVPLASVRFWGKIFGTQANYYIAEGEFKEGEGEDEKEVDDSVETEEKEDDTGDGPREKSTLKKKWKPKPPIPREAHRVGSNKKVYFVCNEPGEPWIKLPHVSPAEIVAARKIIKFFTGRLDTQIKSYPPFPGNESQLLRAQISRISACTQISPAGFYIFDDNDDEEEEDLEEAHKSYMVNDEFEGLSINELTDPSMTSWVHHAHYLLPQGRCSWFNPYEKEDEDTDEEESEDEANKESIKPETGPTILSSVADDSNVGVHRAWSVRISSKVLPDYAVAVAHSNLWPGAVSIAKGKFFENLYIGWGQKYLPSYYNPPAPPEVQQEFPTGPEINEQEDPTAEEERALKAKEEVEAGEEVENEEEENNDE